MQHLSQHNAVMAGVASRHFGLIHLVCHLRSSTPSSTLRNATAPEQMGEQAHQEQHDENEEEDSGDFGRRESDHTKSQHPRNQSHH
jgi:hypothetical protein